MKREFINYSREKMTLVKALRRVKNDLKNNEIYKNCTFQEKLNLMKETKKLFNKYYNKYKISGEL